jgi:hypothetical protein
MRWASLDEAADLIKLTTNRVGRIRDLSVLNAVRAALTSKKQTKQ